MKFLRKFFSPSLLLLSIFLFSYTFYKSEIIWNGEKIHLYGVYYIFSFLLFIFSIFTFYLNRVVKEYLIISFIATLIGIYLCESYFTFVVYSKTYHPFIEKIYKSETGNNFDSRTRIEIYNDLKKENPNITVTSYPFDYLKNKDNDILPLSGISNSKTIYCNENGYYSIYDSDRYGFNNPNEEWDKIKIDYLLIGDSFTHGACVNRPDDLASVLRTLSGEPALNLGYGNNGPLIEYATLREYLKPNITNVIWIYYEKNDLRGLSEELKNKILKFYLDDLNFSQDLKGKQNIINKMSRDKINEAHNQAFVRKLIKFIKIYNLRYFIFNPPQKEFKNIDDQTISQFKKILELTKKLTIENQSKLYFVYLPEYTRYSNDDYKNDFYNIVKEILRKLDISFIDIHEELFIKEKNPLKLFPFELNNHYTVDAYRKIAKIIYQESLR